jgi:Fic family protein
MYLDKRLQQRLDGKLTRLQQYRPLSEHLVSKLREQFSIEMTYNSNAIEGNTMTLQETFLVLKEGVTIRGKSFEEHLEVKNHSEALHYLYEIISDTKKTKLSNKLIRDIHALVVRTEDHAQPGSYRTTEVRISGSEHIPTPGYQVASEMTAFIEKYSDNISLHPIEFAAKLHHEFVSIHPFLDGNGRTGRLLMNISLMQAGYPLVILLKNDRKKYYRLLEEGRTKSLEGFINFIGQAVERSLDLYLSTLEKSSPSTNALPLSKIAKQTRYGSEYLSLLARQGKIAAHKKGRIWYSNLESIQEYESSRLRKRK